MPRTTLSIPLDLAVKVFARPKPVEWYLGTRPFSDPLARRLQDIAGPTMPRDERLLWVQEFAHMEKG